MTGFYRFSAVMRDVTSWFDSFSSEMQDDIVDNLNLYWTPECVLLYEWENVPLIHTQCFPVAWKVKGETAYGIPLATSSVFCFDLLNQKEAEDFYKDTMSQ